MCIVTEHAPTLVAVKKEVVEFVQIMLLLFSGRWCVQRLSQVQTARRWAWGCRTYYCPTRNRGPAKFVRVTNWPHPLLIERTVCSSGTTASLFRRSRLMAQYEKIKLQYKDYILLFQVGDFYELYGEDASKLSQGSRLESNGYINYVGEYFKSFTIV